jgi:small subunit ribosomal protein S1
MLKTILSKVIKNLEETKMKNSNRFADYWEEGNFQKIDYVSTSAEIRKLMQSTDTLSAVPESIDAEGNLLFRFADCTGIMPHTKCDILIQNGKEKWFGVESFRLGRATCFTITEVCTRNGRDCFILDRTEVQQRYQQQVLYGKVPGDIIRARVTSMTEHEAFCDVGCGICALVPICYAGVNRLSHISERLNIGQEIYAVIREINAKGQFVLSLKELLGTWEQNAQEIMEETTILGTVRQNAEYGIFVELRPNLAALADPMLQDAVKDGTRVAVYIRKVVPERMKIKAKIVSILPEPEAPCELKYYLPQQNHMDTWTFSPAGADRIIETDFPKPEVTLAV